MTTDELRRVIIEVLARLAPEVNAATIDPASNLREQYDLDSMDFLNFVVGLHTRLGIDIPEADYPRLATMNDAVAYLTDRVASAKA